jgi:hypothetical protein
MRGEQLQQVYMRFNRGGIFDLRVAKHSNGRVLPDSYVGFLFGKLVVTVVDDLAAVDNNGGVVRQRGANSHEQTVAGLKITSRNICNTKPGSAKQVHVEVQFVLPEVEGARVVLDLQAEVFLIEVADQRETVSPP